MHPLDATRALMDGLGSESNVCMKCGSRSVGLCAPLDAAALDDMSGESERLALDARDAIFRQGDAARHVYTLTEGMARLTRVLPDGRQAVIGFRFAGDSWASRPRASTPSAPRCSPAAPSAASTAGASNRCSAATR